LLNFFRKEKSTTITEIKTDIHAHWIPGIDDGAKNMDESIILIERFIDLGYSKLIATPHIMAELYPNTEESILEKLALVKEVCNQKGIDIKLEAAAEYYLDDDFYDKVIHDKPLLTFGKNYLLFELGFMVPNPRTEQTIFQLLQRGIKPVIAHPERYFFVHSEPEKILEWKERGALLQLNLGSLSVERYGEQVSKMAKFLIKNNAVDFLGSDCHKMVHLDLIESLQKSKWYSKATALPILNQTL
jgi:tyrosine-protein phosphatase YwqE